MTVTTPETLRLLGGPQPGSASMSAAGFFVLRAPAFPLNDLQKLSTLPAGWDSLAPTEAAAILDAQIAATGRLLEGEYRRPFFAEAIYTASPSLYDALGRSIADRRPLDDRAFASAIRYFVRMCTRSTPFGLFAGCGIGSIKESGALSLTMDAAESSARRTRLDGACVRAAARRLSGHRDIREGLRYYANPTCYRVGDHLRFTAVADGPEQYRAYLLSEVDWGEPIALLLGAARTATQFTVLRYAIEADGASVDEATEFVHEAIDAGLLLPVGFSTLTGPDPLDALLSALSPVYDGAGEPARQIVDALRVVQNELRTLDETGTFGDVEAYRRCEVVLRDAGVPVTKNIAHIDLYKSGEAGSIPSVVVRNIVTAVEALYRIGDGMRALALEEFTKGFEAKFGTRAVPLLLATDAEHGVAFPGDDNVGEHVPVIDALLQLAHPSNEGSEPQRVHPHLLSLYARAIAAGDREIRLSEDDVRALARPDAPVPPASLYVLGSLRNADDGQPEVLLQAVRGPSAMSILGRFAGGSPELRDRIREYTGREAALYPDKILAEIVHIPSGRVANVTARPLVRDYEIPYLAESGGEAARLIGLDDLYLCLRGGRLTLWSMSLDTEVLPRIANAHFPHARTNTPLYRLLRQLEYQGGTSGVSWTWGAIARAPFLPRIAIGSAILSLAQWNLDTRDLEAFRVKDRFQRIRAIRSLRVRLGMPRYVSLSDGDNQLFTDFDSPASIEATSAVVRRHNRAEFREVFNFPPDRPAEGPAFANEIVVPLLRTRVDKPASRGARDDAPRRWVRRTGHAPGAEWLYAKIYASATAADRIIVERLIPMVSHLRRRGLIDKWFFIRYQDPDQHIRLRLHHSDGQRLLACIEAMRSTLDTAVTTGSCDRWVLDTYFPETDRYGGDALIHVSEDLFCADSVAVAAILQTVYERRSEALRWDAAVRSAVALLGDWGYSNRDASVYCRGRADITARMLRLDAQSLRTRSSEHFRVARRHLDRIAGLDSSDDSDDGWPRIVDAIRCRSHENTAGIQTIRSHDPRDWPSTRDTLVGSHVHMHINRMFRDAHRVHEYVLWDWLGRYFASQAARI